MKRLMSLQVDIVGVCNLSCPTCPQGNSHDIRMPKGIMDINLFRRILDKADREFKLLNVSLYSWTEPTLHPDLPLFVGAINDRGLDSLISTNLNRETGLKSLMEAEPNSLRISCSGFTQSIYQIGHRGGDIEKVKSNMDMVAARRKPKTRIHLYWHRYNHNTHEAPLMEEYCKAIGIEFVPTTAYMMPLEKVVNRWVGSQLESDEIENRLLVNMMESRHEALKNRGHECGLQQGTITLNHLGQASLCCATYNPALFTLGDFLSMRPDELMLQKRGHGFCSTCTRLGAHTYALELYNKKPNKIFDAGKEAYRSWGHNILPPKVGLQIRNLLSDNKII